MHLTLNPYSLLALVNISKSSTVLAKLTLTNEHTEANGALSCSLSLALVCTLKLYYFLCFRIMSIGEYSSAKAPIISVNFLIFPHPPPVKPLKLYHKKLGIGIMIQGKL